VALAIIGHSFIAPFESEPLVTIQTGIFFARYGALNALEAILSVK
jgi:hypothetical protein